jgi:plasmid stabilization system protein ParE
LEKEPSYTVEITPEAEGYYCDILEYLYKHHSEESADRKSKALLEKAIALEANPFIGRKEDNLEFLGCGHRYILYYYTKTKAIKIIYFIDEKNEIVYVTDFFPCESDENKISSR